MEHHIADYGEYMPHGMCLLWQPWLVLLWAGSNLLIFLSYTAIPVALFMVARARSEMPQPALVALFASFILLCGITHLLMVVTLWIPIYPFAGWVKLVTGIVSAATAIMLFRLVPDLVRLPSPAALERANLGLQEEIAAHQKTLASLDQQVRDRTSALEHATTALAVQAREAVHRSGNLLSVVHALAWQSSQSARDMDEFMAVFLGRVRALAAATKSMARGNQASAELDKVMEAGLEILIAAYGERVSLSGPSLPVNPTAAQQVSLALHELATNTLKYGLGVNPQARVAVSWEIAEGLLAIVWREQGLDQGPGHNDHPEGFGTMLLTSIIPETLGGRAERRFLPGELVYRLEAPIAAVEAHDPAASDAELASRIIAASFQPAS